MVNGKKVSLWEEKFSLERLVLILSNLVRLAFQYAVSNDTELAKG